VHIHYMEEKCYDEEIFFYHLGCHQWVSVGESLSQSKCIFNGPGESLFDLLFREEIKYDDDACD